MSFIDCNCCNILIGVPFFYSSDRLRTISNMLGDCYAVAVIEKISHKELKDAEEDEAVPMEVEVVIKS